MIKFIENVWVRNFGWILPFFSLLMVSLWFSSCSPPSINSMSLIDKKLSQRLDSINDNCIPILCIKLDNYNRKSNSPFNNNGKYLYSVKLFQDNDSVLSFLSFSIPKTTEYDFADITYPLDISMLEEGEAILKLVLAEKREKIFSKDTQNVVIDSMKFVAYYKKNIKKRDTTKCPLSRDEIDILNLRVINRGIVLTDPIYNKPVSIKFALQNWSSHDINDLFVKIKPSSNISVLGDSIFRIKSIEAQLAKVREYFKVVLSNSQSDSFSVDLIVCKRNESNIIYKKSFPLF